MSMQCLLLISIHNLYELMNILYASLYTNQTPINALNSFFDNSHISARINSFKAFHYSNALMLEEKWDFSACSIYILLYIRINGTYLLIFNSKTYLKKRVNGSVRLTHLNCVRYNTKLLLISVKFSLLLNFF